MNDQQQPHEPFAQWCILELMGHRRLAGYLTEVTLAGHGFLRIDVPEPADLVVPLGEDAKELQPTFIKKGVLATQLYSPQAVYAITPCTEQTAREVAACCKVAPVERWELPRLPEKSAYEELDDEDVAF